MQVGSDKWDSPVFLFLCNCGDESFYELYNIALTALDDVWLEWESCGYMDFPVVIAVIQSRGRWPIPAILRRRPGFVAAEIVPG